MPESGREKVAAIITLGMLLQGSFFKSRGIRKPPLNRGVVTNVLKSLVDSRVIMKTSPRGKYMFTEEFLGMMKREVTRRMPRGTLVRYPDLRVFDISGVEQWTEEELEVYTRDLRRLWLSRTGRSSGT